MQKENTTKKNSAETDVIWFIFYKQIQLKQDLKYFKHDTTKGFTFLEKSVFLMIISNVDVLNVSHVSTKSQRHWTGLSCKQWHTKTKRQFENFGNVRVKELATDLVQFLILQVILQIMWRAEIRTVQFKCGMFTWNAINCSYMRLFCPFL